MLVAAISDTHVGDALRDLPVEMLEILDRRRPELIVHAGDIIQPDVIGQLQTIAETIAVRGDNDPNEFAGYPLPDHWSDTIQGHVIIVTHGDRTKEKELPSRRVNEFLAGFRLPIRWWNGYFMDLYDRFEYKLPALIVGGHLHQPLKRYYKNTLIVNPGAVYQSGRGIQQDVGSSIAFLHLSRKTIEVEFVSLQSPAPVVVTTLKNVHWPWEMPVEDYS